MVSLPLANQCKAQYGQLQGRSSFRTLHALRGQVCIDRALRLLLPMATSGAQSGTVDRSVTLCTVKRALLTVRALRASPVVALSVGQDCVCWGFGACSCSPDLRHWRHAIKLFVIERECLGEQALAAGAGILATSPTSNACAGLSCLGAMSSSNTNSANSRDSSMGCFRALWKKRLWQ
jgi:hypothetical protein